MKIESRVSAVLIASISLLALPGCDSRRVDLSSPKIIENHSAPGSQAPNLSIGLNGTVYLTWIEPQNSGHALLFSTLENGQWTAPKTIASGDNWFVNWADFPSMTALADGTLVAHWLVRSGSPTYAYDIHVASSSDDGNSWSEPVRPHRDSTQTEHGFVSLVPSLDGTVDVVWLDGRRTVENPKGTTALRSSVFRPDSGFDAEFEIDPTVCDCCSTDAVRTDGGTLLTVYRDRTASEVRDISTSQLRKSGWSKPSTVYADEWEIAACPVNGPAVASNGGLSAVSWFTSANDTAKVQVAFTRDGGKTFSKPLRVDRGAPLGRVDVAMLDDESALVSWVERHRSMSRIALRLVTPSEVSRTHFIQTTHETRLGGVPRTIFVDDKIVLAWMEDDKASRIATAIFTN